MTLPENTASERIAKFVCAFDVARVTPEAEHAARRALLDTLGVAFAAKNEPVSRLIVDFVQSRRSDRMAHIWSTPLVVEEEAAALANGTIAHALDYDDVTVPLRGHPSVGIFPALLALGEARGRTLNDVVTSYIVGFQVTCSIADAIVWDHYSKGWHATATIGMFGAAAASAHLLGLTEAQTTNALGIAVSHISGTIENFGSMSKPLQAGQCAAVGLRCAVLAALGFTASRTAMDGKQGFTALYADAQDLQAALERLQSGPLAILESGIEVKKYPMCYAVHRALDGLLELRKEHGLTLAAVDHVNVVASNRALVALVHSRPRSGLQGKFSMQYAVAAALLDGAVRLATFDDAAVMRPAIQDFLPRVSVREAEGPTMPRWTELEVVLKDGRRLHQRIDRLKGSAKFPLTDAELLDKVSDCLAFGGAKIAASEIGDLVLHSENLPLAELLRRF